MSSQVSTQEPNELIRKLRKINRKMDESFLRDYGGLSTTTAFFMSLPLPAWIKKIETVGRTTTFRVVQSNYTYFDAYGVRPEDSWDERQYFSENEIATFHSHDMAVLTSSRKMLVTKEIIHNANLDRNEELTVCKWPIFYGETKAVAGVVIDPSYIEHMLLRLGHKRDEVDYRDMADVEIIKQMARITKDLDQARKNIASNSELIKQFFDNSPIPMWICQYVGSPYAPQKARLPIALHSRGFKSARITDNENERLAAAHKSIIENGHDVRDKKKPDPSTSKRISWPIYMNGELDAIGGVSIGLEK